MNFFKKSVVILNFLYLFAVAAMSSTKEYQHRLNTLSCLVIQCVGHKTTVELRNEAHVTGLVANVDGFMNVTMKKVLFVDPCGNKRKFEEFFVQNRLIRIVQIPSVIDLRQALQVAGTQAKASKLQPEISRARQKILKNREKRRLADAENAKSSMFPGEKS